MMGSYLSLGSSSISLKVKSHLYSLFVDEDIKINSNVFIWPAQIKNVFDMSQNRIGNRREHAEDDVRKKVAMFEDKLNEYQKTVDAFRKKEVILSSSVVTCIIYLSTNSSLEINSEQLYRIVFTY